MSTDFNHLNLGHQRPSGTENGARDMIDIVDDLKHCQLGVRFTLVIVDVFHDATQRRQCLLECGVVDVVGGGSFEKTYMGG